MGKRFLGFAMLIFILCVVSKPVLAVEGTVYETENNNTAATADVTYDDYDSKGALSSTSDVDWWKIQFTEGGYVNFFLGNIPLGCNFDLKIYKNNGGTLIASSSNTGTASELITFKVDAGVNYYIKIYSSSGSSSERYTFRAKRYDPIVVDRVKSNYYDVAAQSSEFKNDMNCYGYALQLYRIKTPSSPEYYLQQIGEFLIDGNKTFEDKEREEYIYTSNINNSDNDVLQFYKTRIISDIVSIRNQTNSSEWTITETTRDATVPAGKRKIAFALKRERNSSNTMITKVDYHFYFRHDDGMWSHKQGTGYVTNKSIDTGEIIRDSNISSKITEHGYDDGVIYFLIGKSAIIDYGCSDVNFITRTHTQLMFWDKAGEDLEHAVTFSGMTCRSRMDFTSDYDCFSYTPTVSGNYNIFTVMNTEYADLNVKLYNGAGRVLYTSSYSGDENFSYSLIAGSTYYLEVHNSQSHCGEYSIYIMNN